MADNEAIALCEEILNLSSPPKPTRIIQIENTTVLQRKDIVQNTSSLPVLAGEVAIAQKNQVLRLEKRVEFLGKLQVILNILLTLVIKNFVVTYFIPFFSVQVEHREGRIEKNCFLS